MPARGGGAQQLRDLVQDRLTRGSDMRVGRVAPEITEGAQVRQQRPQLFALRQEMMQ